MCYRETQCIEYSCGHQEPHTDSKVDCGSDRCRYSAQHVRPCTLECTTTCEQWMGHAQPKVTRRSTSKCPGCLRRQGITA